MTIQRQQVIKGIGTSLALPFLASLNTKAFSQEKQVESPQRMIFLCFGWGLTKETWFPNKKEVGKDWKLTPGLKPMAEHKNDFTITSSQSVMIYHERGAAINIEIRIGLVKCHNNIWRMFFRLAPKTFRRPISFPFRSTVKAASPNKPRQEMKMAIYAR